MMTPVEDLAASADDERLKRLLSYVAADPGNDALRADAAEQALDSGEPEITRELLGSAAVELGNRELNLLGVAQMQLRDFQSAAQSFRDLKERGIDEPPVIFNLAWSLAMEKQFGEALELLS